MNANIPFAAVGSEFVRFGNCLVRRRHIREIHLQVEGPNRWLRIEFEEVGQYRYVPVADDQVDEVMAALNRLASPDGLTPASRPAEVGPAT